MKIYNLNIPFVDIGNSILCSVVFAFFMFSCGNASNEPDFSAVPHAAALPTTELSSEDKTKLLEAAGKNITEINEIDLQNMFVASDEKLHIYAFWNRDCEACLKNIEYLNTLYANMEADKVRIITINADDSTQDVNLLTRSKNIPFETYRLNSKDDSWMQLIDENWTGKLPAIFMVNKSEDLFLKYYIPMEQNQMEAIIQTLVI